MLYMIYYFVVFVYVIKFKKIKKLVISFMVLSSVLCRDYI